MLHNDRTHLHSWRKLQANLEIVCFETHGLSSTAPNTPKALSVKGTSPLRVLIMRATFLFLFGLVGGASGCPSTFPAPAPAVAAEIAAVEVARRLDFYDYILDPCNQDGVSRGAQATGAVVAAVLTWLVL